MEFPLFPYHFKQINTDIKECVKHENVSELKNKSIDYFLNIDISKK